jgi:hypothetical protein
MNNVLSFKSYVQIIYVYIFNYSSIQTLKYNLKNFMILFNFTV